MHINEFRDADDQGLAQQEADLHLLLAQPTDKQLKRLGVTEPATAVA